MCHVLREIAQLSSLLATGYRGAHQTGIMKYLELENT